jgi:hypothetical protein
MRLLWDRVASLRTFADESLRLGEGDIRRRRTITLRRRRRRRHETPVHEHPHVDPARAWSLVDLSSIRWLIDLIIRDDFDFVRAHHTDARVGRTEIDTDREVALAAGTLLLTHDDGWTEDGWTDGLLESGGSANRSDDEQRVA